MMNGVPPISGNLHIPFGARAPTPAQPSLQMLLVQLQATFKVLATLLTADLAQSDHGARVMLCCHHVLKMMFGTCLHLYLYLYHFVSIICQIDYHL